MVGEIAEIAGNDLTGQKSNNSRTDVIVSVKTWLKPEEAMTRQFC